MPRDIPALVADLTARREGRAPRRRRACGRPSPFERLGIPAVNVTDGPNGARGPGTPGRGWRRLHRILRTVRLRARRDVERRARRAHRRGDRRGGAHQGVPGAARAHRQHPSLAARGPQLRVLLGRPAALGQDRGGVRARRAVGGRRHHGEALRRQRRRVRAHDDQLRRRRAHAPRDHARAVRARGARGRLARHHDRLQPAQRRVLRGARVAPRRRAARRVGLRGLRGLRLVRARVDRRARSAPGSTSRCPDPGRVYGPALAEAVRNGEVDESLVDAAATRLLAVFDRLGALDDSAVGAGVDRPPRAPHARYARRRRNRWCCSKNDDAMLPIDPSSITTLAVVGPNAEQARIMGGGSASFTPHYRVPPLDALQDASAPT